jgi:hypothetical protein
LAVEFAEQLAIALDVYQKARHIDGLGFSYCFSAFGHLIRWRVRESLMAHWENDAAEYAEEIGTKFDRCDKRRSELERILGTTWSFDCPICDDVDTFVCELDERQLDDRIVSLKRGVCASCSVIVPKHSPFLVDALCRDQIESRRSEILHDYGIKEA